MERLLKTYELNNSGNYIFINQFEFNKEKGERMLIEMTEFQVSDSRINSVSSVVMEKLQKVAVSIIANNFNVFTFQKYTENTILKEIPVLDSDGNETGEYTTEVSIEYIDNEFFCNGQQMSFEEMIVSFLAENTGFSVVKAVTQKQL